MFAKAGQFLSVSLLTCAALTALSGHALAQPATCDPAYWDAMKAKAWGEAQREISQNQNLIYKADSILEYSCFDSFLGALSSSASDMFSESSEFGTAPPGGMEGALQGLIGGSLGGYLGANFGHDFLGDRGSDDYSASGGGSYNCDVMGKVWQEAKCMNFVDQPMDDFFELDYYDGFDPRQMPKECTADSRWAQKLALATNDSYQYKEEEYDMYESYFKTDGCDADPIPTGVELVATNDSGNGGNSKEEHICTNPGCSYDGSGACTDNPD